MKVQIEGTGSIFDVCELDLANKCVTWYEGQFSRSEPPERRLEIETLDESLAEESRRKIKIIEGDASKDYKCELYDKCRETLLCLKRNYEEEE